MLIYFSIVKEIIVQVVTCGKKNAKIRNKPPLAAAVIGKKKN